MHGVVLHDLIDALEAGRWDFLKEAVDRGALPPSRLNSLLASGVWEGAPASQDDPLLPSYALLRALKNPEAVVARLCRAARDASARHGAAAVEIYRAVLAFDSGHPEALLALAWNQYGRGNPLEALGYAERALQRRPDDAETQATTGWLLWETGSGERATELLRATVERHPQFATAHWYLGHIYGRQGRFAEAEYLLRRSLALAPEQDEAAVSLAWVLAGMGRLDAALELAHAAAQRAPTPHRFAQLGQLLAKHGDDDAALVLLQRAAEHLPGDSALSGTIAELLSRKGRGREALAMLEAALSASPDDRRLLLHRATILRENHAEPQAALVAARIVERWPEWGEGWLLYGYIERDRDRPESAWTCFVKAETADPSLIAAVVARSRLLSTLGRSAEAVELMEHTLRRVPDHPAVRKQLACALLDQRKGAEARPHIHALLRRTPDAADLWTALSAALHRIGRLATARLAARRACRLSPNNSEALQQAAVLELECGNLPAAGHICHALLQLAPNSVAAHVTTAFTHIASGRLLPAERHAEQAVALAPRDADAWRCLGEVRHHQGRLAEAEDALHNAHALAPDRGEILGRLAWVLAEDDRLPEALIAVRKGCDQTPESPERWLEAAEMQALAGRLDDAIASARKALDRDPSGLAATALLARLWFLRGLAAPGSGDAAWRNAAGFAGSALYRDRRHPDAALTAIRLSAADRQFADLARLLPDDAHRHVLRELLERLPGFGNVAEISRIVRAARAAFPQDTEIGLACLYLEAMSGQADPAETARQLRQWGLEHGVDWGPRPPRPRLAATPGRRLHVAYLAAQYHHALLTGVLAAHDPAVVALHLYTDAPAPLPPDLRSRVILHPLAGVDLAASFAANGIDVAVDTVGLHPFHGQAEVLRFLRRRIAPLQCGWLGSWGPGSGLFDVLISDAVALPPASAEHHDERILHLAGGQWSWTPPAVAPSVAPLPAERTGVVTFGCSVRGFRIGATCLETWADLLAVVPEARLMLLGRQAQDWEFRSKFAEILETRGVASERVIYRFRQSYADHLATFADIDIALDTFPANGGLCLPDALWMGVPVVTLAGTGGLAERQGASLLAAAECPEWIARSPAEYIGIASGLAADLETLARTRGTLRSRLGSSALPDTRRIASQLEAAWLKLRDGLETIAAAPDTKSRCQALAQRSLAPWLERRLTLTLPTSDTPDVSVVVVLYNQAGLSLQTLVALADQEAVSFETIIVDNASTDETRAMLSRIDGATVIRNDANLGFLLAANQGAGVARGRHILFLNNDAKLHRGALAAAVRRIESDPSIGVVGGRIVLTDGTLQEAGCMVFDDGSTGGYGRGEDPNRSEFRFVRDTDYVSGAFLLLPRPLWQALGGFDTALAPAYYEDADLCLRVRRAGFRVVYDPEVVLTHVEGGSTLTSDAAAEMMRRNRGAFSRNHADILRSRPSPVAARPLRDRWAAVSAPRILAIDNGVPHVAGGAGNPRARLMMAELADRHVTFFPMWHPEPDWRAVYRTLPATIEVAAEEHAATLEDFLDRRQGLYDVLLVSRPPNMAAVDGIRRRRPRLFDGMRIVYDAEALFAARDITRAAAMNAPMRPSEIKRLMRAELDLAATADAVLAVSPREARLFAAAGAKSVHVVSHAASPRAVAPGRADREGFLFVGALTPGSPNEDSLVWLVENVLPRLSERWTGSVPTVTIIGECRSARVAALASERVRLVGRVEDPGSWYDRAAVFVAPTRFGAGIPLKVIEAACAGVPVVATSLLTRQLGWTSGGEILSARDADGFAAAMAALHRDAALWQRIRDAATARVVEDNDPVRFGTTLRAALSIEPAP